MNSAKLQELQCLPRGSLPSWEQFDLQAKLPILYAPENQLGPISRGAVGETLHRPVSYENGIRLATKYKQLPDNEYSALHDPHLKDYFIKNASVKKQLVNKGLVSEDNDVLCTPASYNRYRAYLNEVRVDQQDQIRQTILNPAEQNILENVQRKKYNQIKQNAVNIKRESHNERIQDFKKVQDDYMRTLQKRAHNLYAMERKIDKEKATRNQRQTDIARNNNESGSRLAHIKEMQLQNEKKKRRSSAIKQFDIEEARERKRSSIEEKVQEMQKKKLIRWQNRLSKEHMHLSSNATYVPSDKDFRVTTNVGISGTPPGSVKESVRLHMQPVNKKSQSRSNNKITTSKMEPNNVSSKNASKYCKAYPTVKQLLPAKVTHVNVMLEVNERKTANLQMKMDQKVNKDTKPVPGNSIQPQIGQKMPSRNLVKKVCPSRPFEQSQKQKVQKINVKSPDKVISIKQAEVNSQKYTNVKNDKQAKCSLRNKAGIAMSSSAKILELKNATASASEEIEINSNSKLRTNKAQKSKNNRLDSSNSNDNIGNRYKSKECNEEENDTDTLSDISDWPAQADVEKMPIKQSICYDRKLRAELADFGLKLKVHKPSWKPEIKLNFPNDNTQQMINIRLPVSLKSLVGLRQALEIIVDREDAEITTKRRMIRLENSVTSDKISYVQGDYVKIKNRKSELEYSNHGNTPINEKCFSSDNKINDAYADLVDIVVLCTKHDLGKLLKVNLKLLTDDIYVHCFIDSIVILDWRGNVYNAVIQYWLSANNNDKRASLEYVGNNKKLLEFVLADARQQELIIPGCCHCSTEGKSESESIYEVYLTTGQERGASLPTNLYIILVGADGHRETSIIHRDKTTRYLEHGGSRNSCTLIATKNIGELTALIIGHQGSTPWSLSSVAVYNLSTMQKWIFLGRNWNSELSPFTKRLADKQLEQVLFPDIAEDLAFYEIVVHTGDIIFEKEDLDDIAILVSFNKENSNLISRQVNLLINISNKKQALEKGKSFTIITPMDNFGSISSVNICFLTKHNVRWLLKSIDVTRLEYDKVNKVGLPVQVCTFSCEKWFSNNSLERKFSIKCTDNKTKIPKICCQKDFADEKVYAVALYGRTLYNTDNNDVRILDCTLLSDKGMETEHISFPLKPNTLNTLYSCAFEKNSFKRSKGTFNLPKTDMEQKIEISKYIVLAIIELAAEKIAVSFKEFKKIIEIDTENDDKILSSLTVTSKGIRRVSRCYGELEGEVGQMSEHQLYVLDTYSSPNVSKKKLLVPKKTSIKFTEMPDEVILPAYCHLKRETHDNPDAVSEILQKQFKNTHSRPPTPITTLESNGSDTDQSISVSSGNNEIVDNLKEATSNKKSNKIRQFIVEVCVELLYEIIEMIPFPHLPDQPWIPQTAIEDIGKDIGRLKSQPCIKAHYNDQQLSINHTLIENNLIAISAKINVPVHQVDHALNNLPVSTTAKTYGALLPRASFYIFTPNLASIEQYLTISTESVYSLEQILQIKSSWISLQLQKGLTKLTEKDDVRNEIKSYDTKYSQQRGYSLSNKDPSSGHVQDPRRRQVTKHKRRTTFHNYEHELRAKKSKSLTVIVDENIETITTSSTSEVIHCKSENPLKPTQSHLSVFDIADEVTPSCASPGIPLHPVRSHMGMHLNERISPVCCLSETESSL